MEGTLIIMLLRRHRHILCFIVQDATYVCAYVFFNVGGKTSDDTALSQFRLEPGSSFVQDDVEDLEEQPLVRHRSRHLPSDSLESSKEVGVIENVEDSPPSSPRQLDSGNHPQHNGDSFPSDEVCPLHIDMNISFFS